VLVGAICLKVDPSQAFRVKLVKYLFEIKGGPGSPFNQPTDLAVGKKGRIYVLDGVNSRVQVFDSQGKFLFLFGKPGSGNGELNMPVGMDIDRQGNVYIADTRNHRLQIFSPDGHYIDKVILPKEKVEYPPDPVDVLIVSPHDEVETCFVTDNDNHRVLVYDKETRNLLYQFGTRGFEDEVGSFRYPFSLAADVEYNNILVVDVLNTRVQLLDRSGKFIRKIGAWGIREGTFFRPKGVATDVDNNIYVSDSYMGVIQVFRPDGSYVSVVGTKKGKEKKFKTPIRIYIDQKQRLFVVEELAHKVSVYSLL
jgi:DNA-binding beta-propeller fold protein YncE